MLDSCDVTLLTPLTGSLAASTQAVSANRSFHESQNEGFVDPDAALKMEESPEYIRYHRGMHRQGGLRAQQKAQLEGRSDREEEEPKSKHGDSGPETHEEPADQEERDNAAMEQTRMEKVFQEIAKFGFQNQKNQIEADLDPNKSAQAKTPPTYVKVHTNHVDVKTLEYFCLPWEHDVSFIFPSFRYLFLARRVADDHDRQMLTISLFSKRWILLKQSYCLSIPGNYAGGSSFLNEDRGRHGNNE